MDFTLALALEDFGFDVNEFKRLRKNKLKERMDEKICSANNKNMYTVLTISKGIVLSFKRKYMNRKVHF